MTSPGDTNNQAAPVAPPHERTLISRNYNRNIVNAAIMKAKSVTRETALQREVKKKNERVIFVPTFNPRLPSISNIMVKHWRTMTKVKKMLEMFPSPPMVAFRQPSNLKALLCKAKLQTARRFPQSHSKHEKMP